MGIGKKHIGTASNHKIFVVNGEPPIRRRFLIRISIKDIVFFRLLSFSGQKGFLARFICTRASRWLGHQRPEMVAVSVCWLLIYPYLRKFKVRYFTYVHGYILVLYVLPPAVHFDTKTLPESKPLKINPNESLKALVRREFSALPGTPEPAAARKLAIILFLEATSLSWQSLLKSIALDLSGSSLPGFQSSELYTKGFEQLQACQSSVSQLSLAVDLATQAMETHFDDQIHSSGNPR